MTHSGETLTSNNTKRPSGETVSNTEEESPAHPRNTVAIFETRVCRVNIATVFLGYKKGFVRSPLEYQRMCNPTKRFLRTIFIS